jgi:hypothetical protein
MEGGHLYRGLYFIRELYFFVFSGLQAMYKRRLRKRESLFSIGTLVGDLDGMFIYRRLLETVKRAVEMECLSM